VRTRPGLTVSAVVFALLLASCLLVSALVVGSRLLGGEALPRPLAIEASLTASPTLRPLPTATAQMEAVAPSPSPPGTPPSAPTRVALAAPRSAPGRPPSAPTRVALAVMMHITNFNVVLWSEATSACPEPDPSQGVRAFPQGAKLCFTWEESGVADPDDQITIDIYDEGGNPLDRLTVAPVGNQACRKVQLPSLNVGTYEAWLHYSSGTQSVGWRIVLEAPAPARTPTPTPSNTPTPTPTSAPPSPPPALPVSPNNILLIALLGLILVLLSVGIATIMLLRSWSRPAVAQQPSARHPAAEPPSRVREEAPAAPATPSPGKLALLRGEVRPATLRLSQSIVRIGRSKGNDLVVRDLHASGHHAEIRPHDGGHVLQDLNSTNGTFVNGKRLTAPHRLHDGDCISVGSTEWIYQRS
jgi:hypothetical protein